MMIMKINGIYILNILVHRVGSTESYIQVLKI